MEIKDKNLLSTAAGKSLVWLKKRYINCLLIVGSLYRHIAKLSISLGKSLFPTAEYSINFFFPRDAAKSYRRNDAKKSPTGTPK
jgi:hypothetical protein